MRCARDGADVSVLTGRVANLEAAHGLDKGADKSVVNGFVHVDALDRAAALAGVVHGAVGQRLGSRLRVGVLADVGRVLAAEFELQLDHARAQRLRDAGTRGVGTGEEQAVNFLFQQRLPDFAATDDGDEDILRHAGVVQQPRHCQTGQCGKFGWLVEHGVTGQQRRNVDVAADKPGVIPGRDVGHQTQRYVLNLFRHAALGKHSFGHQLSVDFLEEEVDAPEQAIEFIARHLDRLAGLARHDGGQHLELGHDAGAKARDAGFALRQRYGQPAGLRGAGAHRFGGDRGGVIGVHLGDQVAVGGVVDCELIHGAVSVLVLTACAASRKSLSSGVSSSVPRSL